MSNWTSAFERFEFVSALKLVGRFLLVPLCHGVKSFACLPAYVLNVSVSHLNFDVNQTPRSLNLWCEPVVMVNRIHNKCGFLFCFLALVKCYRRW